MYRFLFLSICLIGVGASPVLDERRFKAGVVPLPVNPNNVTTTSGTGEKLINVDMLRRERARIRSRHLTMKGSRSALPARGFDFDESSGVSREPFDIQSLKKKRAKSGKEQLTDVDSYDDAYYGWAGIGTPLQNTKLNFDTGSSDLVIPALGCQGCDGPFYNHDHSSTYHSTTKSFYIEYSDGSSATGKVAKDVVSVAGLKISGQSFGLITDASDNFSFGQYAGLMGMGFTANSVSGAAPFFINLANQKKLASNVFSFYLSRHGAGGSEMCLGCLDSSKFKGPITYFPLDPHATFNTQYYWNAKSAGLSYGGSKPLRIINAIFDTGTTLIYLPTDITDALYAKIPGAVSAANDVDAGFYKFPCANVPSLKPISFILGGKSFAINPSDFNYGRVSTGSPYCIGAIVGENDAYNLSTIGDSFLKNWYSVHDLTNRRIGFAKAI